MMDEVSTRKFEMLSRVRDFGAAHPAQFPAGGLTADLMTRIGAAVEALGAYSVAQVSGGGAARQGTHGKAVARARLREDVETVARIAKAIDARVPGVSRAFQLPTSNRDQALLDSAKAFLEAAAPLAQEFALREIGETFWAQMRQDVAAFEAAAVSQQRGIKSRVAANQAFDQKLAEGMGLVRELGLILDTKLKRDPMLLAEWRSSARVRSVGRGPRPGAETDAEAAPPGA
jgi:hypothetical protein